MPFVGGPGLLQRGEIVIHKDEQGRALRHLCLKQPARTAHAAHPMAAVPPRFSLRQEKTLVDLKNTRPVRLFGHVPLGAAARIKPGQRLGGEKGRADERLVRGHEHLAVPVRDDKRGDVRLRAHLMDEVAQHLVGPMVAHARAQGAFQSADERRTLFQRQLRGEVGFALGVMQAENDDERRKQQGAHHDEPREQGNPTGHFLEWGGLHVSFLCGGVRRGKTILFGQQKPFLSL